MEDKRKLVRLTIKDIHSERILLEDRDGHEYINIHDAIYYDDLSVGDSILGVIVRNKPTQRLVKTHVYDLTLEKALETDSPPIKEELLKLIVPIYFGDPVVKRVIIKALGKDEYRNVSKENPDKILERIRKFIKNEYKHVKRKHNNRRRVNRYRKQRNTKGVKNENS